MTTLPNKELLRPDEVDNLLIPCEAPQKLAVAELHKFTLKEIARIFRVPQKYLTER